MQATMRWLMVAVLAAGATAARAQLIDPSTGITVDAATDPMDFSAVASGQPGSFGTEAAAAAQDAFGAQQAAQAASDQELQDMMNQSSAANSDNDTPGPAAAPPPSVPVTPTPTISPKGGTIKVVKGNAVQITLADPHATAVLYYTTSETKTMGAWVPYTGPIQVTGDTTIKALAIDNGEEPSKVATEKFNIKN
jgi:hypothetical protein